MPEHKILITKIRQWIAVNSDSKSDSQASSLTPESLRILARTYCDLVGPLSSQLSRCAQWATKGLFVEACSVCDDYPDLLGIAKEFTFDGLLRVVGNTSGCEIAAAVCSDWCHHSSDCGFRYRSRRESVWRAGQNGRNGC